MEAEAEVVALAEISGTFSRAEGQGHRRYTFQVPADCAELRFAVSYEPKYLSAEDTPTAMRAAVQSRAASLLAADQDDSHLRTLVAAWQDDYLQPLDRPDFKRRLVNMLSISLDDPTGAYRGTDHRRTPEQALVLARDSASPGMVPGPLPAGTWQLTVSAFALASERVNYTIQIGAVTARSEPSSADRPSA